MCPEIIAFLHFLGEMHFEINALSISGPNVQNETELKMRPLINALLYKTHFSH